MQRTIIFQRTANASWDTGDEDPSLSPKGCEQTASIRRKLEALSLAYADVMWASPTARAKETVIACGGGKVLADAEDLSPDLSPADTIMMGQLVSKLFEQGGNIQSPYRVLVKHDKLGIFPRWTVPAKATIHKMLFHERLVRICCHENFVSALALAFIPEGYDELAQRVLDRYIHEACCIVLTLNNDLPTKLEFLEP